MFDDRIKIRLKDRRMAWAHRCSEAPAAASSERERNQSIRCVHKTNAALIQLAKPLFAGMDSEDVSFGRGPWRRAHSDALRRDVAERLEQVGDRLDSRGSKGGEAHRVVSEVLRACGA
jgi:hypothetical protein